jgi:ligand-binding sensor domain-containing protein/signal transduction histidine kinase
MKRIIGLLLFSLLLFTSGYSQQYNFTNYSINGGLSQSVVNCLFQDSKGYIWIGTQNGLNRFNGESFDVYSYSPADSFSISNNWIYAIAEDSAGNIWVGTKGGLNKYVRNENRFQRIIYQTGYAYDVTQYTYDIFCLKNGNVIINTPPMVSVYDQAKESFSHFQSKLEYDGAVKDVKIPILEDSDGKIWIASTRGLSTFSFQTKVFSYFTFRNKSGQLIDESNVTAIYQDKKGMLWVGTTSGLFNFNRTTNQFEEAKFELSGDAKFSFENSCIRSIIDDKNGNLIVGTEGSGLFVLSQNHVAVQNYTSENSEIGHSIVQTLIIDQSENLWIGTLQGISKTDLKKKKFNLYRRSNSPNSLNLLGNVIASLYKDDNGILWVGNWGQGLNRVNRETGQVEHFSTQQTGNHKLPNDFVHVIFKDSQNRLWLGTRDGIAIYDKQSNRFVPWVQYFKNSSLPVLNDVRIYMIIQDRASNYWIGTQNGLYKVNLENSTVEVFQQELDDNHQLSSNLIYSILEDSDRLIWIATLSGLDVYNPVTKCISHFRKGEKGLSDDFIITLCEDRKGQIWIGTSTYLNVYNKKDSTFTYYSQEQGLPNNRIFEIVKDKNNELWIATGKGLCKFNEKLNSFQTFTIEDGLQSLEFNLRAACSSSDGEILLGGMNGFNSFYPDSISKNPYIPNMVFTSFYTTKRNSKEYINVEDKHEVEIGHKVNSFTIEFAALEYTNPQRNKYAYQMEGISDEWVDIGNRKFVPFSALRAGEYTFRVKGSNNDGVWNDKEISLHIIVLPPWWKSIIAYFIYLVLIILFIVVFIKIRERKLRHDKKILEQKILERTLQIEEQNKLISSKNEELKDLNRTKDKLFSIIGHDLGNQFNIIVGFSEFLISAFKKLEPEKIEYHLTNIYHSSRHANELLDNLLTWSKMQTNSIQFNPKVFNVNDQIFESIDLLEGASTRKNIKIKVVANKEYLVYADLNMFSTVFRNLLANAIKFTPEKGKISIHLTKSDGFCEITVKDNGVGISPENMEKLFRLDSNHSTLGTNGEKGTGLGLILCKEFVEKHQGKIWVESELNKGSIFKFTLPMTTDPQ